MPLMDEFKNERAALKNGTFKEKLNYFWDYYKWQTFAAVALFLFVISLIYQFATRKDTVFTAVMMNGNLLTNGTEYLQEFADDTGIDLSKNEIIFDTSVQTYDNQFMADLSYASLQKLTVYTAAGDLDAMVTDTDSIQKYANSSVFYDVRDILTQEQIARYEPYFYYVDQKTVEEIAAANDNFDESFVPDYKDPKKPEEMERPIPVGVYVSASEGLLENYLFQGDEIVLGIYVNTSHLDTAVSFLDFLMKEVP